MLGISKYDKLAPLKPKEEKALIARTTKKVQVAKGEAIDVMFCECCNLPVFEEDAYIGAIEGDTPSLLCGLCYFPRNLDMIRFANSGHLIYAPDLTQEQVSALALVVYYIKNEAAEDQDMMDLVSDIEDLILRRGEVLNSGICQGASTPAIICQFLYMQDEEDYEKRGKLLSAVRLFPSEKLAARQLAYLSTNVMKKYHPSKWVGLVQAMNKEMEK